MIKMRVGCFGFLCSLSVVVKKELYLCTNPVILGHKAKKDEEAIVLGLR